MATMAIMIANHCMIRMNAIPSRTTLLDLPSVCTLWFGGSQEHGIAAPQTRHLEPKVLGKAVFDAADDHLKVKILAARSLASIRVQRLKA